MRFNPVNVGIGRKGCDDLFKFDRRHLTVEDLIKLTVEIPSLLEISRLPCFLKDPISVDVGKVREVEKSRRINKRSREPGYQRLLVPLSGN